MSTGDGRGPCVGIQWRRLSPRMRQRRLPPAAIQQLGARATAAGRSHPPARPRSSLGNREPASAPSASTPARQHIAQGARRWAAGAPGAQDGSTNNPTCKLGTAVPPVDHFEGKPCSSSCGRARSAQGTQRPCTRAGVPLLQRGCPLNSRLPPGEPCHLAGRCSSTSERTHAALWRAEARGGLQRSETLPQQLKAQNTSQALQRCLIQPPGPREAVMRGERRKRERDTRCLGRRPVCAH